MDIEKQVGNDIRKYKKILVKQFEKGGLYENFGQTQVRYLNDKYFQYTYARNTVSSQIQSFSDWCMNYNG